MVNLGLIAKEIQKDGDFTFPSNLNVTSGLNVTGSLSVLSNNNFLPHGTIVMWTQVEIPNGWIPCDGSPEAVAAGAPDLSGDLLRCRKPFKNNANSGDWDGESAGYPAL